MDDLFNSFNALLKYGPLHSWKALLTTLLVIAILGAVVILNKGQWTRKEKWSRTALWFYIYIIILYTLLTRTVKNYFDYNWLPFWSYQYIWSTHDFGIVSEVFINCLMFIPFGVLAPFAMVQDKVKKRNIVIISGFALSASVECLQLFTKTGLFEWDDIIHNTIGVIVGYGIYLYIRNQDFQEVKWYFLPLGVVLLGLIVAMI